MNCNLCNRKCKSKQHFANHFGKAHLSYTLLISESEGKKVVQAKIFNLNEDKTILCDVWSDEGIHKTYFALVNGRASIFSLTSDNRILDWRYININGTRRCTVIRASRVKVKILDSIIQNERTSDRRVCNPE